MQTRCAFRRRSTKRPDSPLPPPQGAVFAGTCFYSQRSEWGGVRWEAHLPQGLWECGDLTFSLVHTS